jgi:2-polyprenyl-6-methoxyphenol hydroxylase-like FAD-dependent oxidoreductase
MKNQYGKNFSEIERNTPEGRVTAVFDDGQKYTGDIIVGTDGARSKVRECLLGKEKAQPEAVDIVLYNMNVRYGDAAKALAVRKHSIAYVGLHPTEGLSLWTSSKIFNRWMISLLTFTVQDVPDPDKPETWEFQVMPSWRGIRDPSLDDAGRLKKIKEFASLLAEPWKSELLWIPEGTPVADNAVSYWITSPWDNADGSITLAGDSAHPLPPRKCWPVTCRCPWIKLIRVDRGQGLNHCICDAANFVKAIKEVRVSPAKRAEAISAYEEELVKRGSDEVQVSLKSAILIHDWEKFMESPVMKKGYVKG